MPLFDGEPESLFLTKLVDHRREELNIDYKQWLDLSEIRARAKLAKHICALANFGGGWIVLGVDDNGTHSEPYPANLNSYSQDTINQIVGTYLAPNVHCNVLYGISNITRKPYPIIRIPSHGTVPIVAKANGPLVGKKVEGIIQGCYYTREPGPKSAPITSPEQWRDIIHRCVVNERTSLLSSIGRLFDRPASVESMPRLDQALKHAWKYWDSIQLQSGWLSDPKTNAAAYSFRLHKDTDQAVDSLSLQALQRAIAGASDTAYTQVHTGWAFFLSSGGKDRPHVFLHENVEGYEAAMVTDGQRYQSVPTMWRATGDGIGIEIRLYREDSANLTANSKLLGNPWTAGTAISPGMQGLQILQFVAFVCALCSYYPDAKEAELCVEYRGLNKRIVADPIYGLFNYGREYRSNTDSRKIRIRVAAEGLAGDGLFKVARELIAPIFRLFDGWDVSDDYLKDLLKNP
jgi:hypothetical protein